ncbi:MAG: HAD family phosphatase [Thermoclostridium sp.]|nr:HAD family phosphatase [Thermoclostridium sp.]
MKYRLLAVDIDGTLLNNKREITQRTKKAIHQTIDKGVIFTISSGRPIQGVEIITKQLEVDIPVITYNGAMVITGNSKNIIYSCNMRQEDVLLVERLGTERNTTIAIWSDNQLFVNRLDERAVKYSQLSGTQPKLYKDVHKLIQKGIHKLLWYDTVERIHAFEKEMHELVGSSVNFHTSQPIFLEFVDVNASKAIALEKLGEHYRISREEMIAIGDGFNDLSMIEYAGLGVAMENAPEEIKKLADCVTLSNENDGVAYIIEQFILTEQSNNYFAGS